MKINIQQQTLNSILSLTSKGITSKSVSPILKCIFLEANKNYIKLIGSDNTSSIEVKMDLEVENPSNIAIPSKLFIDIIRKLNAGIVNLELENLNLNIKSGDGKFKLNCMDPQEYPVFKDIDYDTTFMIDLEILKNMIEHTSFAASTDEVKKTLQGIKFEIKDNIFTMVALDLYRVAIIKKEIDFNGEIDAIVPATTLIELLRILNGVSDEKIKISISKRNILFEFDNIKLNSLLIEGEYLNYKKVIPSSFKSYSVVKRDYLYDAVDRISLMSQDDNKNSVIFNFKDYHIKIYSEASRGSGQEIIDNKLEGDDIKIAFNPKYILDGLKVMNEEEIEIKMIDGFNPCILSGKTELDYTYMVLPIRITENR